MRKRVTIHVLMIVFLVKCLNCDPVIKIDNCKIIGKNVLFSDHVVYEFLSVPYAQPPTGHLRFKKPEPIHTFPNELRAFNLTPVCPQYTEKPYAWISNSTDKSEDCLYLNIWTPSDANPCNRKAVLYWIYGGGLRYGSIRLPLYSGIPLAALGDIIVVTVNYRVGPFGFFTSGTEDAPGNVGLWDILEGLRWVNKYIRYFGGDISRITVAGHSAGSWSVGLLSVSPLARSLYKRQIMESGSPVQLAAENNAQNLAKSQRLAEKVGCASPTFMLKDNSGDVVQCLRKLDSAVLAEADYSLDPIGRPTFIYQYGDEILPENPRISILKGDFQCSELLIGSNHDEGSVLIPAKFPDIFGFFGEKETFFNKSMGAEFIRKVLKNVPALESVVQHYLSDTLPEDASGTIRYQTYTSIGDMLLLCPGVYYAEKCSENGGNVYSYFFNHRPSNSPFAPWMGTVHFDEVSFVFGSPLLNPSNYTEEEHWISRQIIEIWSSFAKEGKPSIPWPKYSKEEPLIKLLGPGNVTKENGIGPHKDNCDFFRSIITSV